MLILCSYPKKKTSCIITVNYIATSNTPPFSVMVKPFCLVVSTGYDANEHDNDIALLQLNVAAQFSSYILPACLPENNLTVSPGTICWASGWGQTQGKNFFYFKFSYLDYVTGITKKLQVNKITEQR